jgi:lytic murein transglycosylase
MLIRRLKAAAIGLLLAVAAGSGTALGAACGNDGSNFGPWLEGFKGEATALGISPTIVSSALNGVTYDASVIKLDRNQKHFKQSFEQFSGRMIPPRMKRAQSYLKQQASLLSRIEERYGVPGEVVVALWGLETDFGAVRGKLSTLRSLATLAYDCRRSDFFTGQLIDALQVVQRGDLSPAEMRGGWAGELGQTQFLPSSYIAFAVDFDGDGRRNLISSVPDVLASTANYLAGHGWQPGQPWTEGTANFGVLLQWNKAQVYTRTVAEFARRLSEG